MSATYNWAYKPGVINKYGLVVPASADNVKPLNWCYVAIFGNDLTGNGSRQLPFKTLTRAMAVQPVAYSYFVIGSGVYRELATINVGSINQITFLGDGDVTFDVSFIGSLVANCTVNLYNLNFRGNGSSSYVVTGNYAGAVNADCVFDGCGVDDNWGWYNGGAVNCIFKNWFVGMFRNSVSGGGSIVSCTFHNCSNLEPNDKVKFTHCIFSL